ncbi:MAG: hypothetical protein QW531_05335 [Thermoplasmata archaeon]
MSPGEFKKTKIEKKNLPPGRRDGSFGRLASQARRDRYGEKKMQIFRQER